MKFKLQLKSIHPVNVGDIIVHNDVASNENSAFSLSYMITGFKNIMNDNNDVVRIGVYGYRMSSMEDDSINLLILHIDSVENYLERGYISIIKKGTDEWNEISAKSKVKTS